MWSVTKRDTFSVITWNLFYISFMVKSKIKKLCTYKFPIKYNCYILCLKFAQLPTVFKAKEYSEVCIWQFTLRRHKIQTVVFPWRYNSTIICVYAGVVLYCVWCDFVRSEISFNFTFILCAYKISRGAYAS